MRRPLLMGNWKMYKTVVESEAFAVELLASMQARGWPADRDIVIAPTSLALWTLAQRFAATPLELAVQDVNVGREGALTGALSPYLAGAAGARWTLVGHSERRRHFGERDVDVVDKAWAAVQAGFTAVVCIGEPADQHQAGQTEAVLGRQLQPLWARISPDWQAQIVIAYEPIWAIGSGQTPTLAEIEHVTGTIRNWIGRHWPEHGSATRILYGGSVNPDNLPGIWNLATLDGALVGGASLQARDFAAMATTTLSQGGQ